MYIWFLLYVHLLHTHTYRHTHKLLYYVHKNINSEGYGSSTTYAN